MGDSELSSGLATTLTGGALKPLNPQRAQFTIREVDNGYILTRTSYPREEWVFISHAPLANKVLDLLSKDIV